MGKQKPTTKDPRKPYKFVRVKDRLAAAGEARAGQLEQNLTQYTNDALRMRLEAEGFWPPAPPAGRGR